LTFVAGVAEKKVVIRTASYREDLKTCHNCHRDHLGWLTYFLQRFPSEKSNVADVAGKKVVYKTASYREDLKTCHNCHRGRTGRLADRFETYIG